MNGGQSRSTLTLTGMLLGAGLISTSAFGGTSTGSGSLAGHCLAFDGVDDLVHVVRSVALEPAEITVEMWARLDGPQDWNSRLLRKGEHDAYFITADQDNDQRMQLLVTRGTEYRVTATDIQPHTAYIGTWHHFVGVYSTNQAEFFVDGAIQAQVSHDLGALTHLPLTDLYIGAGLPVTLQNEYFRGRIDEVRIWNHARDIGDIEANWSGTYLGTEPGLVAYWRFDEGSGQIAHDSSPFGHDGELGLTAGEDASDPTWVVSDAPIGAATGSGYALAFDGVEDLVLVPRSASLEPEEITVEMWARLNGPQDWNTRLLRKAGHFGNGYTLSADRDFDQRMQFIVSKDGVLVQARDPAVHTVYDGAWHHFAGVYGTNFAQFWVDGYPVANEVHALGPMSHVPLTDLYLGAGLPSPEPGEYFAGQIDEVRIWNRARSVEEIQRDWYRQLLGTEPGLVAYWKFNEGAGQTVYDQSTAGNDGQLGATSLPEPSDPTWVVSDIPLDWAPGYAALYCYSHPNSTGVQASMTFAGSFAIQDNTAAVEVVHAPVGHAGVFFYGRNPFQVPMGDGNLCISPYSPGLFRLMPPLQVDFTGHAVRQIDFGALSPLGQITPGTPWRFQFWFRDWAAGGTGTNLSDAMEVTFWP
ncbi:MAG: LamG domain-containing protein [Planctomycetota bacterium]|nr:LamG domain-containing protein [Planctomycetota bacterium]